MPTLTNFLAQKPLYYAKFDALRMQKAYKSIHAQLRTPKVIHIVGTNGKGTTGRFLAHLLHKAGFSVGHYSSPHILRFNERIWLDGNDSSDAMLEEAHQVLLEILPKTFQESLSYFEYTTLLAMQLFQLCDYVVLEAGLGGEFDATNVFDKILSLVTPIGYDHQDFLGDTLEAIATTKLNSVCTDFILSVHQEERVWRVANKIAREKGVRAIEASKYLEHFNDYPEFLVDNLNLAMSALSYLGIDYQLEALKDIRLFGRFEKIAPNITIDVGHNLLALEAIKKRLGEKKIGLIYNSYADKPYEAILKGVQKNIQTCYIIDVEDARMVKKEVLEATLRKLDIAYAPFQTIQKDIEYLVFGSFVVVEAFLRRDGVREF